MLRNSSNFLLFAGYSCLSCTVPVENVSHNLSTTGQNFELPSICDWFVSGVTLTLGALLARILRPLWPIWCPSSSSCILPFYLGDFVFARHFWRPWSDFSTPYDCFCLLPRWNFGAPPTPKTAPCCTVWSTGPIISPLRLVLILFLNPAWWLFTLLKQ